VSVAGSGQAAPGAFPRVAAVVGLGLIGGSLAMRLRDAGARVVGVDVDPGTVEAAQRRGAIDEGALSLEAVAVADLVVVATPLDQVAQVAIAAARRMRPGSVLIDAGSVKAPVVAAVDSALPPGVGFVGGHPMAGSDRQGIAAADPALLADRLFILTPTSRTAPETVATVEGVVRRIGMRPIILDPVQHDELVAQVSHLPYLISLALLRAVADDARSVAGPALADMTRIARSPAALWTEICRQNRDAIVRALARYEAELARLRRGVETGKIGDLLREGEAARSTVPAREP
jgi:prephenate dehydrogenase